MEKVIAVLFLLVINFAQSTVFYNLVYSEDPCMNLCEKIPLSLTNSKYVKSCCQRGCRFFNLVDLRSTGLEPDNMNGTRDACESSCTEAYTESQDRLACNTGCDFMAMQRLSDLLKLFSVAMYIEDGVDSNIFLMSPDIPESDILSDPGLRKELLPGWWDSSGFKLPQTYIKTVPLDAGTMDYSIPSDYSGESEQSGSTQENNWFQCALKDIEIPHWLFASAFVIGALAAFWPCFSPNKVQDPQKEIFAEKPDISEEVAMYMPDDAPLYKQPPPKYADIANIVDVHMKV